MIPEASATRRPTRGEALRAVVPGLVILVVGLVSFFAVLEGVRERDDLLDVDETVLEWLSSNRSDLATTLLTWVTDAFGPVVLPVLVTAGCLVWWRVARRWWDPVLLVGAMLLSTLVSVTIKAIIARPRPDDELMTVAGVETSFSFPSGHTIGATTLVLVSGYLIWARHRSGLRFGVWLVSSVVIVVLVAGSRLYLGYHFVSDVLAAICLAVVVLGVVVGINGWARSTGMRGATPPVALSPHDLDDDSDAHPAAD